MPTTLCRGAAAAAAIIMMLWLTAGGLEDAMRRPVKNTREMSVEKQKYVITLNGAIN